MPLFCCWPWTAGAEDAFGLAAEAAAALGEAVVTAVPPVAGVGCCDAAGVVVDGGVAAGAVTTGVDDSDVVAVVVCAGVPAGTLLSV